MSETTEATNSLLLVGLILIPLMTSAGIAAWPDRHARSLALAGSLLQLVLFLPAALAFDFETKHAQHTFSIDWFQSLGIKLSLGVDGVTIMLLALTVLLGPLCVLGSWTAIKDRPKTFYAWLMILQAAITGVFCARDLVLFYVCFEFTLIPMFVLINLFGSTNRTKAAIKFFLYTFTGSVITLAGLIYVAWVHASKHGGVWDFDIETLAATARSMSVGQQTWVLVALLCGFGVKIPLFPFHTWLPLAHTEAPTAGSVILAGTLLKLGTYGMYRFALGFTPDAMAEHHRILAIMCVIGIIYGGLICWVQRDVKKLVAYSSVAHLGFCILGLVSLNYTGITGSVLYMINHGLSTGALFFCIGFMYERLHTRNMSELGGLAARMPVWAFFVVFFAMASVGLPGLNGFVSEFMCLMGSFQASSNWGHGEWGSALGTTPNATLGDLGPGLTLVAGTGMIIAAMYLLYMVGKVVWGPLVLPHGHDSHGAHDSHGSHGDEQHALPVDLTGREIGILTTLAILCIALGVYPKMLTSRMDLTIAAQVKLQETALAARQGPTRNIPDPSKSAAPSGEPAKEAAPAGGGHGGHAVPQTRSNETSNVALTQETTR